MYAITGKRTYKLYAPLKGNVCKQTPCTKPSLPPTLKNVTETMDHSSDSIADEMKPDYLNTYGHFRSPTNLLKYNEKCQPYSNINKKCGLCLFEQFVIMYRKQYLCTLNERNELASSYPHRNKYM